MDVPVRFYSEIFRVIPRGYSIKSQFSWKASTILIIPFDKSYFSLASFFSYMKCSMRTSFRLCSFLWRQLISQSLDDWQQFDNILRNKNRNLN